MLKNFSATLALLLGSALLAPAATLPRQTPDLKINLVGGQQIQLSQYKGKVVVMAFLLTYCQHCQNTTVMLTKMQNEYGPKGLQVVGAAIEDMAAMAVPDFIKKFQPTFPVGFVLRDTATEYLQHSAIMRMLMPQVAFIDRKGAIRAQYSGDDKFFDQVSAEKNLRAQIEALLKEGAPARKTAAVPAKKKES